MPPNSPVPLAPASIKKRRENLYLLTARTIIALILREMSSRYGRSPGGYIWAVLEPLGGILVLAICFNFLLSRPPMGKSFILFYATGYLPFIFFQMISVNVSRAITYSKPLLSYPSVTWIDTVLARLILNATTHVTSGLIIFMGIFVSQGMESSINLLPILNSILMLMILCCGVGMINCVLIGLFPIWETIWSVITRPLFLASGVLLLYENVPANGQAILWYNPLVHISGTFRTGFYETYDPQYVSYIYVYMVGLVLFNIGFILLQRFYQDVLTR